MHISRLFITFFSGL